jgi:hypothetical protein
MSLKRYQIASSDVKYAQCTCEMQRPFQLDRPHCGETITAAVIQPTGRRCAVQSGLASILTNMIQRVRPSGLHSSHVRSVQLGILDTPLLRRIALICLYIPYSKMCNIYVDSSLISEKTAGKTNVYYAPDKAVNDQQCLHYPYESCQLSCCVCVGILFNLFIYFLFRTNLSLLLSSVDIFVRNLRRSHRRHVLNHSLTNSITYSRFVGRSKVSLRSMSIPNFKCQTLVVHGLTLSKQKVSRRHFVVFTFYKQKLHKPKLHVLKIITSGTCINCHHSWLVAPISEVRAPAVLLPTAGNFYVKI